MCTKYPRHIANTVCAKKKKDILNIHIKFEEINIFFTKILPDRVYYICGHMSKTHIYSPISLYHELAILI